MGFQPLHKLSHSDSHMQFQLDWNVWYWRTLYSRTSGQRWPLPIHMQTNNFQRENCRNTRPPTSRISLILDPPFPISEPHWLPGKTKRSVTGGLLVTVLFVIAAVISWGEIPQGQYQHKLWIGNIRMPAILTSSNLCAIMEKALKIPSVGPVMVTILSGDDPSDMLMRAPLWEKKTPKHPI